MYQCVIIASFKHICIKAQTNIRLSGYSLMFKYYLVNLLMLAHVQKETNFNRGKLITSCY